MFMLNDSFTFVFDIHSRCGVTWKSFFCCFSVLTDHFDAHVCGGVGLRVTENTANKCTYRVYSLFNCYLYKFIIFIQLIDAAFDGLFHFIHCNYDCSEGRDFKRIMSMPARPLCNMLGSWVTIANCIAAIIK